MTLHHAVGPEDPDLTPHPGGPEGAALHLRQRKQPQAVLVVELGIAQSLAQVSDDDFQIPDILRGHGIACVVVNTDAQMAGQQAYQGYLQGLNDVMPELYQLALETYDRQNQNLLNRYGALADREAMDYSRYQDNYGLWADQRDYLADQYDSERDFDYTQFRDMVGDDQWMAQFQEDIRRYDFQHKLGEFASLASSGGSGSGGSSGSRKKKKDEEEEENKTYLPKIVVPNRTKPNLYTDESY